MEVNLISPVQKNKGMEVKSLLFSSNNRLAYILLVRHC